MDLKPLTRFTTCTPLWCNPNLPEIFRLKGCSPWTKKGILCPDTVRSNRQRKSFQLLQIEYKPPHGYFYQYPQLRHAFHIQAISSLSHSPIVYASGDARGVLSYSYVQLLSAYLQKFTFAVRRKWEMYL